MQLKTLGMPPLDDHAGPTHSLVPTLGIVVPCYNEAQALPETHRQLAALIARLREQGAISGASFICYVDDGSRDATWAIVEQLAAEHVDVRGIKLSRNRGHQNALLAGLLLVDADAIVSLDADLQDDVSAIERMLACFSDGAEIVYGVRASRQADTWFKRTTAEAFYRLLRACGVESVFNHADYRLMSRRAAEFLGRFQEVNLYLRGIIPQLGLRTATVTYDRAPRRAGKSKYPLRRMLALAWEAITSFSVVPLRLVGLAGFAIFAGSILVSIWVLWARLMSDTAAPGWASTLLPMFFLGGMQMLGIGVLGEYLGKIYMETKARPRFLVERVVGATWITSGSALRGASISGKEVDAARGVR